MFDFTHTRKSVSGVTNESNPGIGILVRTNGKSEHVSFYANAIRIIGYGKTWGDRQNITNISSAKYNVQLYDNPIDFRIIRKDNVYYFYYKVPTNSEYIYLYKYESEAPITDSKSAIYLWSSASLQSRFFVYNMNLREIGANEFTTLPSLFL